MKYYLSVLLVFTSLMIAGCQLPFLTSQPANGSDESLPSDTAPETTEAPASAGTAQESGDTGDQVYTVAPGDSLFKVAYKTTGDGSNWRQIAQANELKNPNLLNVGQSIVIPMELLTNSRSVTEEEPVQVALPESLDDTRSPEDLADLTANRPEVVEQHADSIDASDPIATADQQPLGGWLIVTGTYYPREIKTNPGFGTDILLLATPGSRLRYTGVMNGWYTVETDKGVGYIESSYIQIE